MHVPLSQLLAVGRPPDHPVAVGRSGPIPFSRLACDVAHNAERLRTAAYRCGAPVCVDSPYDLLNALVLEPGMEATLLPAPYDPAAIAVHFFTSGSTGAPKRITGSAARLAAAVVLEAEGQEKRAMLGDFCFGRFLRRLWRFVEALPQGMMGKRRDADLAAQFTKDPET